MRYARLAIVVVAAGLCGCGGGEDYVYEVENPDSPETVYANEVYSRLQEMKQQNANEGPGAIDTIGYIEGMQGYGEDAPVGEKGALFDEIHAGVNDLKGMIDSGASQQEVAAKLDELIGKAEGLPHTTPQ